MQPICYETEMSILEEPHAPGTRKQKRDGDSRVISGTC